MAKDDSTCSQVSDDDSAVDVVYRVDAAGRLTFVNKGWDRFALQNDTPELVGAAALGRPVADFIAGDETKLIYERLLLRAESGVRISLPYRCDSPLQRRRMTLAIDGLSSGEVELRSHVVSVEDRESVGILEPLRRRSEALLTLCSWCNRGRVGGRWEEIEVVVSELQLFEAELPRLTHDICPQCQALVSAGPLE